MINFRSPLEKKWSHLFTAHGWQWTYIYTKGSPPQFWLTLPTNANVHIFVSVVHTDVRLSDRFEMLKGHIARLRTRKLVPDSVPVLAVSSSPFVNREFEFRSEYLAECNFYSPNCIGFIDYFATENRVYGPVMVRKLKANEFLLYWVDERDNWQHSGLDRENKPLGYYNVMVDKLPWYTERNDNTIRMYDIGNRETNRHTSSLIDDYLWKPPRGLMVRKMMRDVQELAKSDGILFSLDGTLE